MLAKTGDATAIASSQLNLGSASDMFDPFVRMTQANQFGADPATVVNFLNSRSNSSYFLLQNHSQIVAGINDSLGTGMIEIANATNSDPAATLTINNTTNSSYPGNLQDPRGNKASGPRPPRKLPRTSRRCWTTARR